MNTTLTPTEAVGFITDRESNARTYARTFDAMFTRGSLSKIGMHKAGSTSTSSHAPVRFPSGTTTPM
jgi:hypothetical protein